MTNIHSVFVFSLPFLIKIVGSLRMTLTVCLQCTVARRTAAFKNLVFILLSSLSAMLA